MGWFSKIFKGSNRKVSDRRYDCRCGSDTADNHKSTSWNSGAETEDTNRAIALSLSEHDRKGKSVIERELQLKEDELLARAMQESLNAESQPEPRSRNGYGYGYDNLYQPITIPYSTNLGICAGCNMYIGNGRFLNCMNAVWHPECFRCSGCKQPISDYQFSLSGNNAYHKNCYKEVHYPKCDVCRCFISTNAAGLVEYRAHPFWSQKYCPRHEHDATARCSSCERMEARDASFAVLNDGRKLCLECLDSAIMNTNECQPLLYELHEFFNDLNMKMSQKIPLLLVEKTALNEAIGGEQRHGNHHHMPETRGICLSEESTISTNRVRREFGWHCEVTGILILYGLPRLLTGTILAHEMMHAWLRLNGFRGVRQVAEEGICQVIASMWLESQILSMSDANGASTSSSSSSFEKKLSQFLKHQIATDTSAVYGDGFRAAHRSVLRFGLQSTLDHLRNAGDFPH